MATKKSPNKLYWDMIAQKQVREEYTQFLQNEGQKGSPHFAHVFALKKYAEGYRDMTIRNLILFLEGELPYMFD
jgi:hypothetical protein